MATAYIGLGANLGDPRTNIEAALGKLEELGTIEKVSSLYKTEPVGFSEQPWFLNGALMLDTTLMPEELLAATQKIQKDLGRTPGERNAPRPIDIDILLYDDAVSNTDALTIPHPHMHERRFVLAPLSEIAPEAVHPVLKKTAAELLQNLDDAHSVTLLA